MSRTRHTAADEPHFLIRTFAAAFSDGQALDPHAHEWGQLIYAASGVLSVWTEEGSWIAPPHWAIWAPPRVRHAMRFTGAASLRTLYLNPARWPELSPRSAAIAVSPLLQALILRATEIGMLDERVPKSALIADLIVAEMQSLPAPPFDLPMPAGPLLRRIAEEIVARPADRIGSAALAQRFGLGARTLERGFLAETGLSLGDWRRQARLLHALRLIGAGMSVKVAASEAGYQSASAFIAAFRTVFGTTPARYFALGGAA